MTTLTMSFGMFPISFSSSSGSKGKSGLAWALIGGLTSSMFLTLLLVPAAYMKVDEWKDRFPAFFRRLLEKAPSFGIKERFEGPRDVAVFPEQESEQFAK